MLRMVVPRCGRTTTAASLLVLLALLLLSASPQAAPHRQRLYDLAVKPDKTWDSTKWGFQLDVPWYVLPEFRAEEARAAAHHWQGSGHETYATFYATRDAHMSDPYFIAAQQLVYRVLWDPKSRSEKHPMTVFVAPFISDEQRAYFTAAGALVRELPVREFIPLNPGSAGRLRDMFSKLEMWNQTEFSKIAYLDSDAFPLTNIDAIFNLATEQTCNRSLLPAEDAPFADAICPFTFAGYQDFNGVNAGVLTFNPNEPMYNRLIRESLDKSQFDNGFMEQALLNLAYDPAGPFPPTYIDHAYNGGVDTIGQGKPLYVVHHKLWMTVYEPEDAWYKNTFNDTWNEMLHFYHSDDFYAARRRDGIVNHIT